MMKLLREALEPLAEEMTTKFRFRGKTYRWTPKIWQVFSILTLASFGILAFMTLTIGTAKLFI